MHGVKVVLLCVVCAMAYGIVHDQVTARVCVEYFTIGHARVFGTEDPTLLGLGRGVRATWWAGVLLGVPLAFFARVSSLPKLSAGDLVRPLRNLMLVCGMCAAVAGVAGYLAARQGLVALDAALANRVPIDVHARYMADDWAHNASYTSGFIGGIVLMGLVWRWRLVSKRSIPTAQPGEATRIARVSGDN